MKAADTVIIGFADALSAPEVVWSLTEAGFRVVAFAKSGTRPALLKSRFATVEFIADPAISAKRAISDLNALARRIESAIWMPLDDISLWLIRELSNRRKITVAGATKDQADIALGQTAAV